MRHPRIVVRAVTWNLFHGRDDPPASELRTWRSRVLRTTERDATHAQVNRPLRDEFAAVASRLPWEIALLQEAPPRWLRPLCESAGASGASALTSRNFPHFARAALARLNPDLIGSNEGGSNQVLARSATCPPHGGWLLVDVARATIALRPERRRMLLVRLREPLGRELVVANLHATVGGQADEVLGAADRAAEWSRGAPLVFGGDLNLRPEQAPAAFHELERRHGLRGPTAPDAIDHLLARGLTVREHPHPIAPEERELPETGGRAIRLSDHSPVVATFEVK